MNLIKLGMFCITLIASALVHSEDKVYVVGVVPQFEAKKLASIWVPILKQLSNETDLKFKLKGSPTISAFEKSFMAGKFDFVYMNPYHFVLGNLLQGYLPLIRDGSKKLQGILVVKKDSLVTSVSELDGSNIVYPSPNALGASLQMRQELFDIFKIKTTPVYVKTHDSVYLNVLLGDAPAGGGVGKTLKSQKPEYQGALRILHKTTPVSPHPFAAHPRVSTANIEKVRKALLKMGQDDKNSLLIAKIPIAEVIKAIIEDYDPLKKMDLERFYVKPE
jgi:phosphonate transport system substrate-binding protein